MVKLSTKSFRKSREFLDTPPETPVPSINNEEISFNETSDGRDSSDSDTESRFDAPCSINHDGKILATLETPIHIDELFAMMFTNSNFCIDTITRRNITEYDITGEWQHDPQSKLETRQVTFTLPLNGMGPKESHVTETQIMNKCSKPGVRYSIDVWAENAGIPYADSFQVLVHSCLERVSDNITRLTMYGDLKYKKAVWGVVKGFIERAALPGLDNYGRLIESSLAFYSERGGTKRRPRSRRLNAGASSLTLSGSSQSEHGRRHSTIKQPPENRPRSLWVFLMVLLLVAVNTQLYIILQRENTQPCMLNIDTLKDKINEGDKDWNRMEEWTQLVNEFTAKQTEQLLSVRRMLYSEIGTLKKTEEAISTMIQKLQEKDADVNTFTI